MIQNIMNKDTISAAKKPFPKIGILYDSHYNNTGDKSMGIVMADFLNKNNIPFTDVSPFAKNKSTYDLLIIGGGQIIRNPADSYYNNFRIWGRHILNTADVTNAKDLQFLNDYEYVSVRSLVAVNKLGKNKINAICVPDICIAMQNKNTAAKIPKDSVGIHFMPGRSDIDIKKHIEFVKNTTKTNTVVLMPFTHYAGDYKYLKKIHAAVPKTMLLGELEPQVLFDTIGELKMLVSMSLHATIFAYSQNINFIVAEEPRYKKVGAFLKDRGLQHRIYTDYLSLNNKTKFYLKNQNANYNKELSVDKVLLKEHFAKILTIIKNIQPDPKLHALYSEITAIEDAKNGLVVDLQEAQNKLGLASVHTKNLKRHTKNLEQELVDMQNSTSWVLTKPLRISKAWILVATKILKIRK